MSFQQFTNLATDDYQKRDGAYPKSDIPDSINVYDDYILFSFKNTSEGTGRAFAKMFAGHHKIDFKEIDSNQDGDYEDDWINVFLYPKDEVEPEVEAEPENAVCPVCHTSAGPAYLNDDEINCNQCGETFYNDD